MFGHPLVQMAIVSVAGWVNRKQLAVIMYLREENRVLRELLGKRRLRFNDDQRRRLAVPSCSFSQPRYKLFAHLEMWARRTA